MGYDNFRECTRRDNDEAVFYSILAIFFMVLFFPVEFPFYAPRYFFPQLFSERVLYSGKKQIDLGKAIQKL